MRRAPRSRERLSQLRRMWALLLVGSGAGFAGAAFVLTSLHHWFVNPDRNASLLLIPLGLTSILIGLALLLATSAVYVFGRNRIRTSSEGFFVRAEQAERHHLPSLISLKKACEQILPAGGARAILDTPSARQASGVSSDLPQDSPIPPDIGKLQSEMNAAVKAHWKAFLFEGIVLALLGLAAMIVPPLASLAVTIFLGWMFLISGVAGLFVTYWARQMPGFWWSLFSAALAVLAGGILLGKTRAGRPHAHHRDRRLFSGRGRRHHHVRAGAPPRIVGALVLAADLGRDGPPDRVHHRRRAAGFGGMGDRPPGRDQPRARRRVDGRHGARRAPILTPPIMG